MSTLRKWREANQVTQQQLAERLGVRQSVVSYMEVHGVSLRKVRLVSEVTGIPVEDLLPPASSAA